MSDSKSLAFAIATILAEHKARDVVVLDLKDISGWTDYFVIATCSSSTHLRGLSRSVEEFLSVEKIESLNKPIAKEDESWLLHDLGDVVVHIMNQDARTFYELEKLWFKAQSYKIEVNIAPQQETGA